MSWVNGTMIIWCINNKVLILLQCLSWTFFFFFFTTSTMKTNGTVNKYATTLTLLILIVGSIDCVTNITV